MTDYLKEYEGTWGLCNAIHSDDMHPEDYKWIEEFRRLYQANFFRYKVFYCSSVTPDGYLVIDHMFNHQERQFRVRSEGYQIVPTPKFFVGDHVREINDHSREGIVYAIVWHYKRERVYYHVRRGEHYSNKYNFEEEIELVP